MKITLVNTYDVFGGAARAMYRLFRGLCQSGNDCTLVVAHKKSNDPRVMDLGPVSRSEMARAQALQADMDAELAPYPALRRSDFVAFHSERAAIGEVLVRRLPPADLINLHWVRGLVDYPAFFESRSPGQPVVWTLHDMNAITGGCHYSGGCGRFAVSCGACPQLGSEDPNDLSHRILERKISALARRTGPFHVVAPSRWLAAEAKRSAVMQKVPISVIPYGLETDVFMPHDRLAARRTFNLPPDLKIVLFVAHVPSDPRKGLALLDEALCRMGPRDDIALLVVGDGPVSVQAPVHRLRTGMVSDDAMVSRLYSAADLLVVPSLEDNLPNTVLEAMASGIPVVGFPIGGVPDMIESGVNGFLAPECNSAALATILGEALSDLERLRGLGRNARAKIENEHTIAAQSNRYLDLYRSLVGLDAI